VQVLAITAVTCLLVLVATMASPCARIPHALWPDAILRQQLRGAAGDDMAYEHVDLAHIKQVLLVASAGVGRRGSRELRGG
jgi:hypothetical protein